MLNHVDGLLAGAVAPQSVPTTHAPKPTSDTSTPEETGFEGAIEWDTSKPDG